jgi:hypothetical protein
LRLGVQSDERPGVAVVVPVTERPAPLDDLYREYALPLASAGLEYEFIFVVNQSALQRAEAL